VRFIRLPDKSGVPQLGRPRVLVAVPKCQIARNCELDRKFLFAEPSWKAPKPRYNRGVLAKYAARVTSASFGALTDMDLKL
jgi:dihydroxyacid dehydratase/phosphogluconate dehydratase